MCACWVDNLNLICNLSEFNIHERAKATHSFSKTLPLPPWTLHPRLDIHAYLPMAMALPQFTLPQ